MTNHYTDLHHLTKNSPANVNGSVFKQKNRRQRSIIKTVLAVLSLTIIIYSAKLLLMPIGQVLGAFLSTSATTISLAISGKELKNDNGVTNFLIVGIDRRSNIPYSYKGPNGITEYNGFNTDTIIIASFNKNTASASLLSVPRDLWINIPGFKTVLPQQGRINSVMALGDQFGYPQGGMSLLAKVLENDLGTPIHYWIRVDFDAFEKTIDAVDEVDVFVENSFTDYLYPIYGQENNDCGGSDPEYLCRFKKVSFEKGLQHMNGETALEYARSRHALGIEGSDFSRAKRQQKVIMALKDKILSSDTFFDLGKIKSLYAVMTDKQNVSANIDVSDLPLFYSLGQKFSLIEAKSYVLDNSDNPDSLLYHPSMDQFGGAWVLLPRGGNFNKIKEFIQKIFYSSSQKEISPSPTSSTN